MSTTEHNSEAQEKRKVDLKPKLSTILASVLAAFNIFLAVAPQFEISYLAPIGVLGAASIVAQYRKLSWGRLLAFGAALLSLSVAITAMIASVILYPSLASDLLSYITVNVVHLVYFVVAVSAFAISLRKRSFL